jgi:hypothetical protein
MPISFSCPGCRRPYQVQDQMAGQGVKCACGSQFVVPQARLTRAAPPPPQDNWLDQELAAHQQRQAEAAAAAAAERERAQNPYASPGIAGMHGMGMGGYGAQSMGGMWREGNLLVMDRGAKLPNICVKTGQPSGRFLPRNLSWQPPWLRAMAFVFGWLIYAILVANYGKKATIHIALSDEWFQRRTIFMLIGWIGSLAGLAIGGGLFALGASTDQGGLVGGGITIGALIIIASAVTGTYGARMVWADLITDRHIWVGGVCEAFLQHLPPWTGGRPH